MKFFIPTTETSEALWSITWKTLPSGASQNDAEKYFQIVTDDICFICPLFLSLVLGAPIYQMLIVHIVGGSYPIIIEYYGLVFFKNG